eukprot:scaffold1049_cov152-Skeletonema_menzelii.AAC.7
MNGFGRVTTQSYQNAKCMAHSLANNANDPDHRPLAGKKAARPSAGASIPHAQNHTHFVVVHNKANRRILGIEQAFAGWASSIVYCQY